MANVSYDPHGLLTESGRTLPQIFYHRVLNTPGDAVVHEVEQTLEGMEARPIVYGELFERVRRAADQLARLNVESGDRVLLMVNQPSCFLAYFFGAMGLGAVPVPLPVVGKVGSPAAFYKRIESVNRDCEPRVIVSEDVDGHVRRSFDSDLPGSWLDADACLSDRSAIDSLPDSFTLDRPLNEIAYLQYTSGSTGYPRGVIVTQRNLSSNLHASIAAGRFSSSDRCVSWLPLYHDMGLVGGPLLGICLGSSPYLMEPLTFVTNPVSWLRAIDKFKATFTVAPNFAYSIIAHKVPDSALQGLDLSSLRLAFDGGEPIDHETVDLFLQRFASYGFSGKAFYPVYGLAEATLAVSFPEPDDEVVFDAVDRRELVENGRARPVQPAREDEQEDIVTFVGVGKVVPDHEVIIRDPETSEIYPDRQVGEIYVRGASVSPGYFGEINPSTIDNESQRSFEAATGDLGYLADGELFVVDRIKDIIIVAGRKYAPSDIERQVAKVEGVRRGAIVAIGVPGPYGTELLHLIVEADPKSTRSLRAVRDEISGIVRQNFNLSVSNMLLVPPNSIPKTSSGKVQRYKTREMMTADEFESMDQWRTRVLAIGRSLSKRIQRWIARKGG